MNRFEKAALRIQKKHSIHVEWADANREYVVDSIPAGNSARNAEKLARRLSLAVDRAAKGNDEDYRELHR
jgi:glyceraldehyde-3-phosphate dehydrogenase/erythrose-4-phosphate dehydrogenase